MWRSKRRIDLQIVRQMVPAPEPSPTVQAAEVVSHKVMEDLEAAHRRLQKEIEAFERRQMIARRIEDSPGGPVEIQVWQSRKPWQRWGN